MGLKISTSIIIAISVATNDLLFLPIWPEWLLKALGDVGNPKEGRLLEWAAGEVVKRHLMRETPALDTCRVSTGRPSLAS
jgi:UDP-N-acetylglucosamine--dolichyl-phosphate N-acetylglucosaminephosphotransferase